MIFTRRFFSEKITLELKKQIASEKVLIFSKNYCPYCVTAKKTLSKTDPKPTIVELDYL